MKNTDWELVRWEQMVQQQQNEFDEEQGEIGR